MNELFPSRHVGSRCVETEVVVDELVHSLFLEVEWYFVKCRRILCFDDRLFTRITEECDFLTHVFRDVVLCTENDDVWLNPVAAQLFDAVLRRFRLHLTCRTKVRNERTVNVHDVLFSDVIFYLANGFDERKRFDISDCSTNLCNDDISVRLTSCTEDTVFDFIRDMRNDLNRSTVIVSTTLFFQDSRINAT